MRIGNDNQVFAGNAFSWTTESSEFALGQARKSLSEAMKFHSEGKLGDAEEHYRGGARLSLSGIGCSTASFGCRSSQGALGSSTPHGTMTEWIRLSPDIERLTIDLARRKHTEEIRVIETPAISDGMAAGIVQWMKIDLADGIEFPNHPDDHSDAGWLQVLHPSAKPETV